jgi:ABC-type Fe3+-hydroxamate transport system substrate-binding protein
MRKEFKDQLGNRIVVSVPPQRIISLVPSQTELLFDLGATKEIAGITKFCIHPQEGCSTKEKVGGTKNVDFKKVAELRPDLIIANKEENTKAEIEILQKEYPVWVSDIHDLNSALKMMEGVRALIGREVESEKLIHRIESSFRPLKPLNLSVAYFIWRKPYMTVGHDTFIHSMLSYAGFKNVFTSLQRYPEVNSEILKRADPDLIFLSSEPYPFKEKHMEEFKIICPRAKVILVDGEYFSWYGSRLLGSVEYFQKLREEINSM